MKKVFLCITVTLLLFSCQKLEDYFPHNGHDKNNKSCRIQSIFSDEHTAMFYYNSKGNPDSILYSDYPSTGHPEYHFVYDNSGRMTQMIEAYRYEPGYNVFYEAWHLYQYNNKGQIISDTTYFQGTSEPGFHPNQGTYVDYIDVVYDTYTYDAQGRMVQTTMQVIAGADMGPAEVSHFSYDAAGNMVRSGVTYSAARNLNNTNRLWQFLNRDYSVNSPDAPAQVNENNLPLKYETGNNVYPFLSINLVPSNITYDCSQH